MDRIEQIPVEQIVCDQGHNVARTAFTLESLHEFSCSIRDNGLRTPVTVRPSGRPDKPYLLVCGFRRFHAVAFVLKHATIKAFIKKMSDEEAVMENIIENIDRENLNPIEEARAMRIGFKDWTEEQICKKLNRSRSWVGFRLSLLRLPEEVQLMIAAGRLKVTDATRINQEKTPEDQLDIARLICRQREKGSGNRPRVLKKGKALGRTEMEQLNTRLINAGLNWLAIRCISRCAGHISDEDINEDIARALDEKKRREKGAN